MNVINAQDLPIQRFKAHDGTGEIEMRFAFPHFASRNACWNFFGVATIPEGSTAGLHTHVGNDEWFYILSGTATLVVDGEARTIASGDIVLTRSGSTHEITAVKDRLTFIAIEVRRRGPAS